MYLEIGSASAKGTVHQRDLSAQGFSHPCLIAVKGQVQSLTCRGFQKKNPPCQKNVNSQISEPFLLNKMCWDSPDCAQGCTAAQGRTPSSLWEQWPLVAINVLGLSWVPKSQCNMIPFAFWWTTLLGLSLRALEPQVYWSHIKCKDNNVFSHIIKNYKRGWQKNLSNAAILLIRN